MRISIVIFCISLFSCNAWKHNATFNYSDHKCEDFIKLMNADSNFVVVDVRTPKEYRKGHMKNAINISYFNNWFTDSISKLNREKTIYMYCQTQHRSPLASKKMKKMGFKKIIDLKGGFMKWENKKLPIEN